VSLILWREFWRPLLFALVLEGVIRSLFFVVQMNHGMHLDVQLRFDMKDGQRPENPAVTPSQPAKAQPEDAIGGLIKRYGTGRNKVKEP
jgi:hypothetical protein